MKVSYVNKEVGPVSDCVAEAFVLNMARLDIDIHTSNETVIDAARALVAEGKIKPFILVYKDREYPVNEYGVIADYPEELCYSSRWAERTLRAAMNKRKAERGAK